MQLFVMRHGEALAVGGAIEQDSQRPLSPRGRIQVRQVAEGLKRRGVSLQRIVSSPLLRAKETASGVAETFQLADPKTAVALAPQGSPAKLRDLLDSFKRDENVLLVGHHPDVSMWIAFLTGLDISVCPLFGTASVAAIKVGKKSEFLWFQTAEQLALS